MGPRGRTSQQHRAVLSADSRQRNHNSGRAGPVPALEDGVLGTRSGSYLLLVSRYKLEAVFWHVQRWDSNSACYLPRNANARL